MQAAAKAGKAHGMLSIIGLDDKSLEDICAKVRAKLGKDAVCQLANYLFPTGRVVSGHKDALNEVQASINHHCMQFKISRFSWTPAYVFAWSSNPI